MCSKSKSQCWEDMVQKSIKCEAFKVNISKNKITVHEQNGSMTPNTTNSYKFKLYCGSSESPLQKKNSFYCLINKLIYSKLKNTSTFVNFQQVFIYQHFQTQNAILKYFFLNYIFQLKFILKYLLIYEYLACVHFSPFCVIFWLLNNEILLI